MGLCRLQGRLRGQAWATSPGWSQDKQARWFVVTASWNDTEAAIDNDKLVALGARMLAMLHQ